MVVGDLEEASACEGVVVVVVVGESGDLGGEIVLDGEVEPDED